MAQIKLNATYGMTGTLPAVSGANLTNLDATDLSGNLPALNASALTNLDATDLSGTLPALNASSLTNLDARDLENALPAISGASLPGISAGKVVQVVTAQSTASTTTSTSFAGMGLTVDITPSATTSKVLVMVTDSSLYLALAATRITIYRDSTNIGNSSHGFAYIYSPASGTENPDAVFAAHILDSPSTTSAVTYRVYAKTASGTLYMANGGGYSNITVMEIGA